MLKDGEVRW